MGTNTRTRTHARTLDALTHAYARTGALAQAEAEAGRTKDGEIARLRLRNDALDVRRHCRAYISPAGPSIGIRGIRDEKYTHTVGHT